MGMGRAWQCLAARHFGLSGANLLQIFIRWSMSWRIDLADHYSRYGDQAGRSALLHHRSMTGWVDKAACRQFDPELFFPLGSGPAAARQAARAKAVCACCQVSAQCLTWALQNGEVDGIWGGLDADERRALNSRREFTDIADLARRTGPPSLRRAERRAGAVVPYGRSETVQRPPPNAGNGPLNCQLPLFSPISSAIGWPGMSLSYWLSPGFLCMRRCAASSAGERSCCSGTARSSSLKLA